MGKTFSLGFKIELTGGTQSASQVALLEKALKDLKATARAADETAAKLKDSYKLNDAEVLKMREAMKLLNQQTKETGENASLLGSVFQGVGQQIGRNLLAGVQNLATALPSAALSAFVEFDSNIRQAGVISQSSEEQIAGLRAEATRLGIETSKTPAEISAMTVELARAGFTAEEQTAALEGIVRASEATGESLGLVGDIVGKTIRTFGLAASESGRVADLLTATANSTNSSIDGLGESLKYLGPSAAASNQNLDDTLVLLGLLGDQGIQGSQAGTNLAMALERLKIASAGSDTQFSSLVRGSARMTEAFNAISVEARNADGSMKPLTELLPQIQKRMQGFSQQDQDVLMKALFGVEGGRAFQALLNTSPGRIALVTAQVKDSQDLAKESGEALLKGLGGSLKLFTGSLGSALGEVGGFLAIGVEPAVRGGILLINTFLALPDPIKGALLATATFTTVLSLAAAAVAAYNAVNGAKIVSDTLAAIASARATLATIAGTLADKAAVAAKGALLLAYEANIGAMLVEATRAAISTAWTAANTLGTQVLAAAKVGLAVATGQATAAQLAQTAALRGNIAALAKGGVAAGLFVGAAASVLLVAETFGKVTEKAGKTREGIAKVEASLAAIGNAKTANAKTNIDAIREGLGPVQRALDDFIRGPIPGLATATEAAVTRSELAFDELIGKTIDVTIAGRQIAGQLEKGLEVDPAKVKATVESIDAALEALRQQAPTNPEDIAARDEQIKSFEALKERILGTTDGVLALDVASEALAERMKALGDELKSALDGIDLAKLKAQAKIMEDLARGDITQQTADSRINNLENNTLEQRFQAQSKNLVRLRELQAAAKEDPEKLALTNKEIVAAEGELAQTRIDLAQETVDGKKDAIKAEDENEKEASRVRIENAKTEADGIKVTRERQSRESEQVFDDETKAAKRAFDDREEALQRTLDDEASARQRNLDAQVDLIGKGLDAEKEALADSFKASKEALDKRQELEKEALDKSLETEKEALDKSLEAAKGALDKSLEATKDALDERQKLEKETAERGFSEEEKRIERQLQLRNAAPGERKGLQAKFTEEDKVAAERERAFADLEARRKALEDQQAAEQEAAAEAAKLAQEALAAETERQQKELKASQELAQKELKASQELAQEELTARKEQAEQALELRRKEAEEQIAAMKLALEDELEAKKRTFEDAKQARDRAFQDEQQQKELTFKDQQRRLDEASAARQAAIIAAAKPKDSTSLRVGGPVEAGGFYRVHQDEFFVPAVNGTVLSQQASRVVVREALAASQVAMLERRGGLGGGLGSGGLAVAHIGALASTAGIEQRLDTLIKVSRRTADSQGPAAQENYFVNDPDPYGRAAELRLNDLRLRMRGRGV